MSERTDWLWVFVVVVAAFAARPVVGAPDPAPTIIIYDCNTPGSGGDGVVAPCPDPATCSGSFTTTQSFTET